MSQKTPERRHDRAAKQRRKQAAEEKRARKDRRVALRQALEKK